MQIQSTGIKEIERANCLYVKNEFSLKKTIFIFRTIVSRLFKLFYTCELNLYKKCLPLQTSPEQASHRFEYAKNPAHVLYFSEIYTNLVLATCINIIFFLNLTLYTSNIDALDRDNMQFVLVAPILLWIYIINKYFSCAKITLRSTEKIDN